MSKRVEIGLCKNFSASKPVRMIEKKIEGGGYSLPLSIDPSVLPDTLAQWNIAPRAGLPAGRARSRRSLRAGNEREALRQFSSFYGERVYWQTCQWFFTGRGQGFFPPPQWLATEHGAFPLSRSMRGPVVFPKSILSSSFCRASSSDQKISTARNSPLHLSVPHSGKRFTSADTLGSMAGLVGA